MGRDKQWNADLAAIKKEATDERLKKEKGTNYYGAKTRVPTVSPVGSPVMGVVSLLSLFGSFVLMACGVRVLTEVVLCSVSNLFSDQPLPDYRFGTLLLFLSIAVYMVSLITSGIAVGGNRGRGIGIVTMVIAFALLAYVAGVILCGLPTPFELIPTGGEIATDAGTPQTYC